MANILKDLPAGSRALVNRASTAAGALSSRVAASLTRSESPVPSTADAFAADEAGSSGSKVGDFIGRHPGLVNGGVATALVGSAVASLVGGLGDHGPTDNGSTRESQQPASAVCSSVPAAPNPLVGKGWRAHEPSAAEALVGHGVGHGTAASPTDLQLLCSDELGARQHLGYQLKILGDKASTPDAQRAAQALVTSDATVLAQDHLLGSALFPSRAAAELAQTTADAKAAAHGTGDAAVSAYQDLVRKGALLAADAQAIAQQFSSADQAVLSQRPKASHGSALASVSPMTPTEQSHLAAELKVGSDVTSALQAGARNIATQADALELKGSHTPVASSVVSDVAERLAKGESFETISSAELHAFFQKHPDALRTYAQGVEQRVVAPLVESLLHGYASPKDQKATAGIVEKSILAGESEGTIQGKVRDYLSSRPWSPHPIAARIAPSSMSEAEQYRYYLGLANNVFDLRQLGDRPILMGIRGQSVTGQVHGTGDQNVLDDTMVMLDHGKVTKMAASTHPTQSSTSTEYQAQGDVALLKSQAAYGMVPHGDFNGGPSWDLRRLDSAGKPLANDNVPVTNNANKDGSFSNDPGTGGKDWGNAVLVHPEPYSVGCNIYPRAFLGLTTAMRNREMVYVLVSATPQSG